jgi:uncharacterized membrane protein YczE
MERQLTDDYERVLLRRHEQRVARPLRTPRPRPHRPVPLGYVSLREHPGRRLPQLLAGLVLYGFGLSLTVRAGLGVIPWSVLNEGLERHTPLSFGMATAAVGALVLLLWIPLRQRPAVGTVANITVLAVASDLGLHFLPTGLNTAARTGLLVAGILMLGLATAVYVGARLGPGPRDGLMTGASATTGRSLRRVRTGIELAVLAAGWALGGDVGVGTVLAAVSFGPLAQALLPYVAYRSEAERAAAGGAPPTAARPSAVEPSSAPAPSSAAEFSSATEFSSAPAPSSAADAPLGSSA